MGTIFLYDGTDLIAAACSRLLSKESGYQKNIHQSPKLKSAHLDFLMQAFAIGFAYLLEFALKAEIPIYVVVPLIFGSIANPSIFLLEATRITEAGFFALIYKLLKALSPLSLFFAWFFIAFQLLPGFLKLLLIGVVLLGLVLIITFWRNFNESTENNQAIVK